MHRYIQKKKKKIVKTRTEKNSPWFVWVFCRIYTDGSPYDNSNRAKL